MSRLPLGALPLGAALAAPSGAVPAAVDLVDSQERATDGLVTLERMRQTIGTGIARADIAVDKPADGPPTGCRESLSALEDLTIVSEDGGQVPPRRWRACA